MHTQKISLKNIKFYDFCKKKTKIHSFIVYAVLKSPTVPSQNIFITSKFKVYP